jgi:hypothetical protein
MVSRLVVVLINHDIGGGPLHHNIHRRGKAIQLIMTPPQNFLLEMACWRFVLVLVVLSSYWLYQLSRIADEEE